MALGAVLGAALTTPVQLGTTTYIDNILVKPLVETVRVTMGGPGTNSGYTFTLDDPTVSVVIGPDSVIRFEHAVAGSLFAGFVESFTYRTSFGGQGRQIDVVAVGNEVIMDWLVTAVDLTFSNNGPGLSGPGEWTVGQMVNRIMTNLTGPTRSLRWASTGGGSTLAMPVGMDFVTTDPTKTFTITAGSTLRAALQAMGDGLNLGTGGAGYSGVTAFTIDPWFGIRVGTGTLAIANDSQTWTMVPAGPLYPSDIRHETDALGLVRSVYVTGTGVSAFVTDGSGILGPTAFLTNLAITTAQVAGLFGTSYLQAHAGSRRGEVGLEYRNDVGYTSVLGGVQIGTNASIGTTLATAGAACGVFGTSSVDLTNFDGTGRYDARFHYGGVAPSGANLIRSLTRAVTS